MQQLCVLEAIALLWPTQQSMFPPIGAGPWKNLNSLNQIFWSELEVKVFWKNLGCLCRLAACFISFFKGLCGSQMVSTYLLSFWGFFWQCCLSKGAICTAQSHTDVVVCMWWSEGTDNNALFKGNVCEIQSFPAQTLLKTFLASFPEI